MNFLFETFQSIQITLAFRSNARARQTSLKTETFSVQISVRYHLLAFHQQKDYGRVQQS